MKASGGGVEGEEMEAQGFGGWDGERFWVDAGVEMPQGWRGG